MLRKILTWVIIIAAAVGLWFAFEYYQRARKPVREAFDCIPGDAVLILESHRTLNTLEKLLSANQMWEELENIPSVHKLSTTLHTLDSVLKLIPEVDDWLSDRAFYASLHLRAEGKTSLLFTWALHEFNDQASLENIFNTSGKLEDESWEGYDGAKVRSVTFPGREGTFYFCIHEGVFFGSYSRALVNEGILHAETGLPLKEDQSFSRVIASAGERNDANLYLRLAGLNSYLELLRNESAEPIHFLNTTGNWAALDLTLNTNQLIMNGYMGAAPNDLLYRFRQQEAQELELLKGIPSSCLFAVTIGIGDVHVFAEDQQASLLTLNDEKGLDQITELNSRFSPNASSLLLSAFSNQAGVIQMDEDDTSRPPCHLFLNSNPPEYSTALNKLCDAIDSAQKTGKEEQILKGKTIRRVHCTLPFRSLLGSPFHNLKDPWFLNHGSLLYFAEDPDELREILEAIEFKKVLQTDPQLSSMIGEQFSTSCNIFFYASPGDCASELAETFISELAEPLKENLAVLKKFDVFSFQITAEKDLYYTNALVHFKASEKKEIATVWETETDAEVHSKPMALINHTNGTKDVLVQDDSCTIYLWSNTGKLLWKRKLDGMILGSVNQVDVFRNGKLQMAFSTRTALYIIDRNGKDLEGFPIKFSSAATAPLAIFDYDNNQDYRFIIPLLDRRIMNFTKQGKVADRWKPVQPSQPIRLPIKHLKSGGKDHLFAVDDAGNILWLNRRGENYQSKKLQTLVRPITWSIVEGKASGTTCLTFVDSAGNVSKIYTSGKKESFRPITSKTPARFLLAHFDSDGSEDLLIASDSTLLGYSSGKKLLFALNMGSLITETPVLFKLSGGRMRIGVVCGERGELYLVDESGKPDKTIYRGNGSFSVSELNKDGIYYLLAPSGDRRVMAWPIGK